MLLARVIGTVVASAKSERVEGQKMLIIQPLDLEGKASGGYVVAFDAVGAGAGEVVLFVTGSSARQTPATDGKPADAMIFAIVDTWEVDGQVKYDKAAPAAAPTKSARKR